MGKGFASRGKERLGWPAFLKRGTSSTLDLPKQGVVVSYVWTNRFWAGLFGPNLWTPHWDPCKFTSYEMLPFSCSSSQDVHNKDHHHKEVDDEAKSQDIIPENHWCLSQPELFSTHHLEEEMIFSTMPALLHWEWPASTTRWESP